jgi:hypothetical protein
VSFGGLKNSTTASAWAHSSECWDSVTIAKCLAITIEDTYLIDPIGKKAYYLKPITTTNPPKMFGHSGVVVSDTSGVFEKKYLYVYGGASAACAQNVCDKMWRLELPWASVGYFAGFAGGKFGNKWEDVSGGSGTKPGQLFSFEMIQVGG